MSDGFNEQCIFGTKKNHVDYQARLLNKQKLYGKGNRDKIDTQQNDLKKYKTDINFRSICRTRSRIYQALRGKRKTLSTKEILGIDIDLYKKWIKWQITQEIKRSITEIDHVKAICMFEVSNDEQLKEAKHSTTFKKDHQQKGIKYNLLDCQLQFIKAFHFIRLNEEGHNEANHWWNL